jgi:hypothetical protein
LRLAGDFVTVLNIAQTPTNIMTAQTPTPKIYWRKLFVKVAAFAATEAICNMSGLSTIANYAEFLTDNNTIAIATETIHNLITLV